MEAEWNHTYLLGWYDSDGHGYLTSWGEGPPICHYVVTHCSKNSIPMWASPVPDGAQVCRVPSGKDPQEYAREVGGHYAIGWDVPVQRKTT